MESVPYNVVPSHTEEFDTNDSLTLSLTPPLSLPPAKDETSIISEHLSSIENDRSMQEIEISLSNLSLDDSRTLQGTNQQPLLSLSTSSIISLNGLEKFTCVNEESRTSARSILDEILSNDQFKSASDNEESLDLFANLNLDNSFQYSLEVSKKFEELLATKDNTIAALTSELDSFREILSSTSTIGTSTTDYKQFQDECHDKLVEYQNAIDHKDEQIEKLSSALQQAILIREEAKQHFKNEITQLQEQLDKTSTLLKEHDCARNVGPGCDWSELEQVLSPSQLSLLNELKLAFTVQFVSEKQQLEDEMNKLKIKCDSDKVELSRLRDSVESGNKQNADVLELRQELDAKHSKEVEELRTYFEQKCADLEKNYSEEVFSQQSRKLSGSSSCSEMSDFVSKPGPAGDNKMDNSNKMYTANLRQNLAQLVQLIEEYNLNDLSDGDLEIMFSKFEFGNVANDDLNKLRCDLQNKYHAELEILREDFENQVNVLNVEHENKMSDLEKRYLEEIDDLNVQLRGRISTTTQQEVNSGDFEIDEVVQSYERRLQEQVTMAKLDIIAALESQIQRLVASEDVDGDWPEELLQLKSRFAENYQTKLLKLSENHNEEIAHLKEEHARALERARRRSLRDADGLCKEELELLKERDLLKKQTLSLKHVIGELIKYFTQCEDELNNTLVEEIIANNCVQEPENVGETDVRGPNNIKRVHITPNFDDLINLIDSSSENDLDSIDLRTELGSCLEKLRTDANAILALSTNLNRNEPLQVPQVKTNDQTKEVSSLTRKLISETQLRNELTEQLDEAKNIIRSLEMHCGGLETQLEELLQRQQVLDSDLRQAKEKISTLIENGHKEIISEGYGEDGDAGLGGLAEVVASLRNLQEKVRGLGENHSDLDTNFVNLLEDLARVGDRIVDEARKDRDDLKQQIEVLEQQLREMSRTLNVAEERRKEAENERTEAVDKIFELRDIIRDLEEQLKSKTTSEEQLSDIVNELEAIVKQQIRDVSDKRADVSVAEKFQRYVGSLESEIERLRLDCELAGGEGTIQQIKNQLCDLETTLDKRTKDLEGLHWCNSTTTCSSPSEDMSIRDVVHQERCVYDECEVPLQQLARLKEKLIRHSRAEDAALKRIRDLEMQIVSLRSDLDDSHTEREILTKQISDHLVLISNLQIRLDEQRIRAEHIEKQTNTSLEVQNYDLKTTVVALEEEIAKRDKAIGQLKYNVEEMRKRLEDREREILENNAADLVAQMQEEVEHLRVENHKLKTKIENETSLNLTLEEVESLTKLRGSGVSLHHRLLDLENFEQGRRANVLADDSQVSPIVFRKDHDKTVFHEPELSTIEKVVASPNLFYSLQMPQEKANSTEKHVRFEDQVQANKISELAGVIEEKNKVIHEYENRISELKKLESVIETLQNNVEATEANLKKSVAAFEDEQKRNEARIKSGQEELEAQRSACVRKEEELEECRKQLDEAKRRVSEKDADLKATQKLLADVNHNIAVRDEQIEDHKRSLRNQNEKLKKLRDEVDALEKHSEVVAQEAADKHADNVELMQQLADARKELGHFEQLVAEKERVIDQMSVDSRSLHVNLETIQNKLRESGNVVDLSRRLREEQKKNSDLYQELHVLKARLMGNDEITLQVRKELDYSAYLDNTLIDAARSEDVEALREALNKQISASEQMSAAKEATEKRFEELGRRHEALKQQLDAVQYEDALLIGQLRAKLDNAFHNEHEFDKMLKAERMDRTELEGQLKAIKGKLSSTKAESLPSVGLSDYAGLTLMISKLEDENNELRRDVHQLQETFNQNLITKNNEIDKLESKVAALKYNEQVFKEELAQLKRTLESKDSELAVGKHLIEGMNEDHRKLLKKLELKTKSTDTVPEQVMESIRELNKAVAENAYMASLITRLNEEKAVLEMRIADLEAHKANLPFDDPITRANYLFAKYLRSESYRKQLAYQKQYLTSLLSSYQSSSALVEVDGAEWKRAKRKSRKIRFKNVAIMVVSVCRMKFLVRRWHTGKRIVGEKSKTNPKFQIGQPVSSQNFASPVHKEATSQPKTNMPWFGTSPPSRETSAPKTVKLEAKRLEPSGFQRKKETVRPNRMSDSLTSPAMLSKYIERFNEIQDKLGLDGSK